METTLNILGTYHCALPQNRRKIMAFLSASQLRDTIFRPHLYRAVGRVEYFL